MENNRAWGFLDDPEAADLVGAFHLIMPDGTNVVFWRGKVVHVFMKGERLGPMQMPANPRGETAPSTLSSIYDHGTSTRVKGGLTLAEIAEMRRSGMKRNAIVAALSSAAQR